jgi:Peptidase family M28
LIKRILGFFLCLLCISSFAQSIKDSISKEYVEKTITYLASDEMGGRVNYSKKQLEATDFLSNKFKSCGLEPFPGFNSFYQPFRTSLRTGSDMYELEWNGRKLSDSVFHFFGQSLDLGKKELSDFFILQAKYPVADAILFRNWDNKTNNILIWIKLPDSINISMATKNIIIPDGMPASDILIVVTPDEPQSLQLSVNDKKGNDLLYNIVGMLPGHSKANEAIIFSAHYDHIDRDIMGVSGEIFNGANDDASGTTAVLALAHYFAMRKDNERSIVFCLFAGEELGLFGSRAFVNYIKPETIKAVINIEMIGATNVTGKKAFFVTGSYYSDLWKILKNNLKDEKIKVLQQYSDPKMLFQRSDNYTFAKEGIPAHSLMCSDDNEPCYHKPCDDVKRIDMENMTLVIQAIAKSCRSLISGEDTPKRIKL